MSETNNHHHEEEEEQGEPSPAIPGFGEWRTETEAIVSEFLLSAGLPAAPVTPQRQLDEDWRSAAQRHFESPSFRWKGWLAQNLASLMVTIGLILLSIVVAWGLVWGAVAIGKALATLVS